MTFIDTQPRPVRFTTRYDTSDGTYIVKNNITGHVVRRDTLEEANEYIAIELAAMCEKPVKLPSPEYGFGNKGLGRNYYESRKGRN